MAGKYGYMAKIGADTSGLTAALSDAERSLRNTSAELKAVNEGLKLEGGENAENQDEADKFVYIGNFKDLAKREDIGDEHTNHILSQLIISGIVEFYFKEQKGYWSTYS